MHGDSLGIEGEFRHRYHLQEVESVCQLPGSADIRSLNVGGCRVYTGEPSCSGMLSILGGNFLVVDLFLERKKYLNGQKK